MTDASRVLLEGLARAQIDFALRQSASGALDLVLGALCEATGSPAGLAGQIVRTGAGEPALRVRAVRLPGLDEAARPALDERLRAGLELSGADPLLATLLAADAPQLDNAPAQVVWRIAGEELAPRALLVAPLQARGEKLGLVALADRDGGYDASVLAAVQPCLDACAGLVLLARVERERRLEGHLLREAVARATALVQGAGDAILTVREDGVIETVNDATVRLFGHAREELVGASVGVLVPEARRAEHAGALRRFLATGEGAMGQARELEAVAKDGTARPVEVTVSEARLPGGAVRYTGILHDIRRRRQAEEDLRAAIVLLERSHEQLEQVLDQLETGVVLLDETGLVGFVNRSCPLFDPDGARRAVGRRMEEVLPLSPAEIVRIERTAKLPQPRRERLEVGWERAGRWRTAELEIRDDPQNPLRRFVFVYDRSELRDLRKRLEAADLGRMAGHGPALQRLLREIDQVAHGDWTVLVEGETGSGKELAARAIHAASRRASGPFVAVNCAGLSESLLLSQLFGHRRGAFTGAVSDQEGLFAAAAGGTLLLDEVGDISAQVQVALLRVLETGEFLRLGDTRPQRADVRVVAATHRRLEQEVAAGRFRQDLYYRLRVGRIAVPALRERPEDIAEIARSILAERRLLAGKAIVDFEDAALLRLKSHPWPGNIRELRNAVDYAVMRCRATRIGPEDLPPELAAAPAPVPAPGSEAAPDQRERLLQALRDCDNNRVRAARALGIGRATLYRQLRAHGIP